LPVAITEVCNTAYMALVCTNWDSPSHKYNPNTNIYETEHTD